MKKKNQGSVPLATKRGSTIVTNASTKAKLAASKIRVTANSPAKKAKTTSDTFLFASSIFDGADDNLNQLEEEFLEAARTGNYGQLEKLLQLRGENCVDVNVRDDETGNTALMFAAKRGHNKLVELLLRHYADVTLRNYEGQTAIELASPAIQQMLLQSVDKGGPYRNLLQAAWQGNVAVIEKILHDCQVDINCTNGDGLTPLLLVARDLQLFERMKDKISAKYSPVDAVKVLLDYRADPCAADNEGKTAVHYAASSKANLAKQLVQVLLNQTHCTDIQDRRCFMPIHCAAQSGSVDVLTALLDSGSEPNSRGFAGATPLHISALNGHEPVCGVLLHRGADVTLVDDSGLTAVDVAKSKRVKATLKEAWAEATEKKESSNQLNPVRPPSRVDKQGVKSILRRSHSFNIGNNGKRTGEVIFDSLHPSGSYDCIPKKSNLLSNAEKARFAEEQMLRESLEHTAPSSPFASTVRGSTKTNLLTPRSPPRSPSRSPPTNRKLAPLKITSPRKATTDRNAKREIKFGPGTKAYDGRLGAKQTIGQPGLKKCPSDPTKFSGGTPPITVMGLDGDEHHKQCWRSQGSFPTRRGHVRQGSDPFSSPTPSPVHDGSDELFLRGRSPSHISVISMSEDWESASTNTTYQYSTSTSNRLSPLKQPSSPRTGSFEDLMTPRNTTQGIKQDSRSHQLGYKAPILNLERMQITNRQFSPAMDVNIYNYPTSKKLLPPTPVYQDPPDTERSSKLSSSKENSPRSDDEDEDANPVTRAKSVLRQGEFKLEDTQVNSSNDSGLPEDKSSSSKSSSVASSTSTFSSGSPRTHENSPTKTIQHSNSTSALSSMDRSPPDRSSTKRTSIDNSSINTSAMKNKRNMSFSNVRENTGFVNSDGKVPSKKGQGNQSGLRKSFDSSPSLTDSNNGAVSDNKLPSSSLSGSRDISSGKISQQSSKLRIIAKDNANNKSNCTFQSKLEVNIEEDGVIVNKHKESRVKNTDTNSSSIKEQDASSTVQSSFSKTDKTAILARTGGPLSNVGGSSCVTSTRTKTSAKQMSKTPVSSVDSIRKVDTQQPQVLQLKAGASKTLGKDSSKSGAAVSNRGSTASASGCNSAAKVIHVQEAKKDTAFSACSESSPVENNVTSSNNVVSSSKTAANTSKNMTQKPKIEPNVSRKGPMSSNINKAFVRQGSVSSSSNTTVGAKQDGVSSSNVPKRTVLNSSTNSAVKQTATTTMTTSKPSVNSTAGNTQRQTSITSSRSSAISKQTTVSTTVNLKTSSVNSSKLSSANRQSCVNTTTSTMTAPTPARQVSTYSSTVQQPITGSKPAAMSNVNSVQPSNKQKTSVNNAGNTTVDNEGNKSKTNTTTMTFSLQKAPEHDNITSDLSNNEKVQLFNNGGTPVAPPHKKRTSAGSRSSSDSGENVVIDNTANTPGRNTVVTEMSVHTLKHGMTPVSSSHRQPLHSSQFNQFTCKKNSHETQSVEAPAVEHEGPRIIDPFESLNERRRKEFAEMIAKEKEHAEKKQQPPKSAKGRSNITGKKPETKQKQERQGSAGKIKRSRQKQTVGEDGKKRPKSSKKKRKCRKKDEEDTKLSENVDNSNVALIGGIGWHIEADCDDRTDVQAVNLGDSDLSDQEINITVVPDYLSTDKSDRYGQNTGGSKLQRELTITVSGTLPGQISGSESDYTDESDFEDIPEYAEKVHDEVQYIFGEGLSDRPTHRERAEIHCGMKLDNDDTEKVVHPQTKKALKHFDKNISDKDLDDMLGTKFPNIYKNTSPRLTNVTSQVNNGSKRDRNMGTENSGANVRRNNSMPSNQKRPPLQSLRKRHPSMGDQGEVDPEIDEMIDEILKSTPNPSLSLSMRSSSGNKKENKPTKSMTREEFADALNQSGGVSFREVLNSSNPKDRDKARIPNGLGDEEIARLVRNRSQAELQELIEWKNKVDDLNEQEQKQLNKLMNTVKNLGLKAGPSSEDTNKNIDLDLPLVDEDISNDYMKQKPPLGPNIRPSDKHMMEKSPRFVRKKESYKAPVVVEKENNNSAFPMDSVSSFGSISIPSDSLRSDDTLVDDRNEVVTSRLGRRSAASSRAASSIMSEEDVIQWKRGNILGKGAYGIVWCGLVNSGELIAVKQIELNVDDMDRAEAEYEKIQQEVDLLKTLKHPNIVGYLGTSLEESTVSIFMQFVPGGSVANLLSRFGALEEELFCNYTKQILEGVKYLHANNVIHRDIKGGNIMLMHNGIIKLIDFGCAKRLCLNVSTKVTAQSKSRLLKSMRGTPYWMAPEVVKETGHGTKSDIWSIGCTVHEMATRKPPWADMPQMTAIFNIGNDSVPVPELPEKFTPEARNFAHECMTRNPNLRPSATDLLRHPFIIKRKKSRSNSVVHVSNG